MKPYHQFHYDSSSGCGFSVIAHRGASAYYPENTIASFRGAIVLQADMVELDVQVTSDGEVVVFHDHKINRCTNGQGKISDNTLKELKKLDAGGWFSREFTGEQIPTLAEALFVCKNKIAVNVEIKTEAVTDKVSGGVEEKCLKIVEDAAMRPHVVFSSFDPRALIHLKLIDSEIFTSVLYEKKRYGSKLPSDIISMLKASAFNCSRRRLSKKMLADLQSKNIPVNVYTINDEKDMQRLLAIGVDGIFTNRPDVLKKAVAKFRPGQKDNGKGNEHFQYND